MKNENRVHRILLISGLVALPLVSVLFDIVIQGLQIRNSGGAGLEPILILLFPLFTLMVALAGLALDRFLPSGGWGIALAYAVVGLLIVFATPLIFFLPVPSGMYELVSYVQPGTSLFMSGALLAAIGLFNLRETRQEPPQA